MTKNIRIDINCDLGEGMPNDAELMPLITSCNIACGGHAGDQESMEKTVELALKHHVNIGAHPSYPDRENFGRAMLEISPKDLRISLREQIDALKAVVENKGSQLSHIKLHGALYNQAAKDEELSDLIIQLVQKHYPGIKLFAPSYSLLAKKAADQGLIVAQEAFADRRYNSDLTLVSRKASNAIINEADEAVKQVRSIVEQHVITTVSGQAKTLKADTVCIHGDHPKAISIAKEIFDYIIV